MAIENIQRVIAFNDTQVNIEANAGTLAEMVFGRRTTDGALAISIDEGATWYFIITGVGDEKAKVSANDTTAGYLNGKLVAGTKITLTENNDGGNETLTIATTATGEVIMADGVTPPDPLLTEDETDWLYE